MPSARIIVGATTPLALLVLMTGATVAATASGPALEAAAAVQSTAPSSSPSIPCPPAVAPSFDAAVPAPGVSPAETAPLATAEPMPCASGRPPSMEGDSVELTADAGDLWFSPKELTISSRGTTTITLRDMGVAVHNLTVDDLDLLVVATPGRSGQVAIVDPPPGRYEFYCSISGHRAAGMVGTLIVE